MSETASLAPLNIKGHKIDVKVNLATGRFTAELPEGDTVEADSLAHLKEEIKKTMANVARRERPSISCIYADDGDYRSAVYVGERAGARHSWSGAFMFQVAPKPLTQKQRDARKQASAFSPQLKEDQIERKNMSAYDVQRRILHPNTDLDNLRLLDKIATDAKRERDDFFQECLFDPTGKAWEG